MTVSSSSQKETFRTNGAPPAPRLASMTALVTGATGFIGSHLVHALLEHGASVRAFARNAIKARSLPLEVDRRFGNLGDDELPEGLAQDVDVVFHLGAAMSGGWAEHERVTVEGTRHMLEMCRAARIKRFIYVSSIMAHETRHLRPGDTLGPAAALAAPDTPLGHYARGKADAERAVRAFCEEHNLPYTILRPGIVYGPGHIFFEHLGSNVRGTFIGAGSRHQLLPFVSIKSVVDALLHLALTPRAAGRAYLIVDEDLPRSAYIDILSEHLGRKFGQRNIPLWMMKSLAGSFQIAKRITRLKQIPETTVAKTRSRGLSLRYDTTSLRQDTGWSPPTDVREGLRRAIRSQRIERRGPIRVGLVGTGNVARMHLNALRKVAHVQVVALFDPAPGCAAALAKEANIDAAFGDAEAFYAEANPDVIHLLTPPAAHCEPAIAALERGVHVLCEKPLALTVGECQRMAKAARDNAAMLCANHNHLFDERIIAARQMVADGQIGELRHVDIFWGFDVRRVKHFTADLGRRTHWAYALPGGLLEDLAPHPLSILAALLGPDLRIAHAAVRGSGSIATGIDEELRVSLESESATGNLALSLTTRPDDLIVSIFGSEATVRIEVQDMLICRSRLGKGPKIIARGVKAGRASVAQLKQLALNPVKLALGRARPPGDPLPILRAFYSALQSGAPMPACGEETTKVVEIIRTIWPMR